MVINKKLISQVISKESRVNHLMTVKNEKWVKWTVWTGDEAREPEVECRKEW